MTSSLGVSWLQRKPASQNAQKEFECRACEGRCADDDDEDGDKYGDDDGGGDNDDEGGICHDVDDGGGSGVDAYDDDDDDGYDDGYDDAYDGDDYDEGVGGLHRCLRALQGPRPLD